jgi:hypothetical protein
MNPVTLIIVVVLILMFFGGGYGWHSGWAYGPHTVGLGTIVVIILLILLVTGRL